MDLATATETLRSKVGDQSGLNAVLKFDTGADGVIVIDGKATPNTVDNVDRDADCTVAISMANLSDLLTGELEPTTGFMTGKFKVSGDMSVALKLQRVV
jgi:putative sterol carrier protein